MESEHIPIFVNLKLCCVSKLQFRKYCEKPPVSREVLAEEMLEEQKSKLKKNTRCIVNYQQIPAFSGDGAKTSVSDVLDFFLFFTK